MSQTFNLPFSGATSVNSCLSALQDACTTLRSVFSGTSEPSSPVAYMLWVDTTNGQLKQRNSGNSDWVILLRDITTAGGGNVVAASGAFTTNAPTSAIAASSSTHLVRKGEIDSRPLQETFTFTPPLSTGNYPIFGLGGDSNVVTISQISIYSNTTTVGSDGSNYHRFNVLRGSDNAQLMTSPAVTNSGEITAYTPYRLSPTQNTSLTGTTSIKLVYDKVGSPTALTGSTLYIVTSYTMSV